MTTYYADFDLATGSQNGSDAANAWRNHQDAIDGLNLGAPPLAAGDIVLSKGTDTISTRIDNDQGSGDITSGFIVSRGVNASWVNDGTRAIIDGNNNAIDLMNFNNVNFIQYENFVFKNTNAASGNDGITCTGYSTCYFINFINCVFDDAHDLISNGNNGLMNPFFYKCQFLNAGAYGVSMGISDAPRFYFVSCIFDTITLNAVHSSGAPVVMIDCYMIDITGNAVRIGANTTKGSLVHSTTFDTCADGIEADAPFQVIGGRFTNNTVGIDSNSVVTLINSYMPNATEDRDNTTNTTGNVDEIVISGSNSNNLAGTDTDGGYAAPGTGDFNLDESKASQYNQAIDLEE